MTRLQHSVVVRRVGLLASVAALSLITACAPQKPSLYVWDTYQVQLYEYFKGDGSTTDAQVEAMELQLQKAAAVHGALPPGFQAHLGLLKLRQGKTDEAIAHFNVEKQRFPESAPYIDPLLRRAAAPKVSQTQ